MRNSADQTSTTSQPPVNSWRSRKGGALVFVLAAMLIVSTIWVSWTRRALADRRQLREQILQQQTERLVQAGLLIVRQNLQQNASWTGTSLVVPAGVIHQTNSGELTISVQSGQFTVTARYPSQEEIPYKVTRTGTVTP